MIAVVQWPMSSPNGPGLCREIDMCVLEPGWALRQQQLHAAEAAGADELAGTVADHKWVVDNMRSDACSAELSDGREQSATAGSRAAQRGVAGGARGGGAVVRGNKRGGKKGRGLQRHGNAAPPGSEPGKRRAKGAKEPIRIVVDTTVMD